MVRYLLAITAILLSTAIVQAQSQQRVSLEDWDVGAVKVTEPKPATPTKGKQTDTKANTAKSKPGTNSKPETLAAKTQDKPTVKKDEQPATTTVVDLVNGNGEADLMAQNSSASVSTGRSDIDKIVNNASKANGVDPNLILSVMRQESGFHSGAVSSKGARGLMQLIPSTAARFGVRNIFDPKENIEGGTKYLRFLLDTFNGDVELALAGYNAGEGAVMRYGNRIPPYAETQNYVRNIVSKYGQKYSRPTDITAGMRSISTPVIIAMSDKGVLTLSNNY